MEFEPWMQWLVPVLCAALTGTGLWAFLSARSTAAATREAAATAAVPASQQASTADWSGLMGYWQSEIKELRNENSHLAVRLTLLEERREHDLMHIVELENHIWQQLPPPPPVRRYPPTQQ